MTELLTPLRDPALAPFLTAAALVLGLLLVEVLLMLLGLDTTVDGDGPAMADLDGDGDIDADGWGASLLDLIGLRGMPLTVWLAILAGGFASIGLIGQAVVERVAGAPLPTTLAVLLALAAALPLTRAIARAVRHLLPRETTSAISERSFGNRTGTVTVGTARHGAPAQVRFSDAHGNLHYAMAEPLEDAEAIGAGTEVMIVRTRDGALRLVRSL